jgi:bifunctional lysine-specific demethylase and histidyl-hydroxylase MINA
MSRLLRTLDDLLAPVSADRFFAEFHGREVLHVPGTAAKFASLMSWETLNELLAMQVWTAASLKLVLDKRTLPPDAYCRQTVDRNKQPVLAPDPERVLAWGRKGASLVLHEVESLVPGMAAACEALERELGANGMINLYCSWRGRQAYDTHFDKHDVFAFHIAGEKLWRIYENRYDNPIEHAAFQTIPQSYFDASKGAVKQEILLRPGDLLYLPRGTYHDAIAVSEACIHLSCGMSEPIGLNWLTAMWDLALEEPQFRATLPRIDGPEGDAPLLRHVEMLAARLVELTRSPKALERARTLRRPRPPTPRFDLPHGEAPAQYRVRAQGLKVVRRGAEWVMKDGASLRPISEAEARKLSWILARQIFARSEFDAAFADGPAEERERLLRALADEGRLAAA